MHVERLELNNFRGIRHLELEFSGRTTVLVGINGVGKSAILDALRSLLLLFAYELLQAPSQRLPISLTDIRNDTSEVALKLALTIENQRLSWGMMATRSVWFTVKYPDALAQLKGYVATLMKKAQGGETLSVPVVVHYTTTRGDLSWDFRPKDDAFSGFMGSLLDAYHRALPADPRDFQPFFEWFREHEDIENERRARGEPQFVDPQLAAVRRSVDTLMEGFSELRIERQNKRMSIRKGDEVLDVDQLSSGEKSLLALVADLSRRLSLANPGAENPCSGSGVVLIDEVDLHLHPRWQRRLLPALERTFPQCQFIVTTHSPQVISEVKPECIYLLERKDGEIQATRPESSFGRDSNRILEDLMGVDERPTRIKEQLQRFFRLIDEGNLDEAKALRQALEEEIGSDEPNFARADVLIRRKEMLVGAPHRPQR
ncbi:MAG TPA: AAA family ATPase [Archangium sp.]|jgi:predicted ATP-binding protein involved in virulence|uniref:AAA family ATPase n=1 Tax=Archangium sp. TaxID=1872627 RepID=UPI002EDA69C8